MNVFVKDTRMRPKEKEKYKQNHPQGVNAPGEKIRQVNNTGVVIQKKPYYRLCNQPRHQGRLKKTSH